MPQGWASLKDSLKDMCICMVMNRLSGTPWKYI